MRATDSGKRIVVHGLRIDAYARHRMAVNHPQFFFVQRIRTTGFNRKLVQLAKVLFNMIQQPFQLSGAQAAGRSAADISDSNVQPKLSDHLSANLNFVEKRI